jgi:hypothetical protein
MPQLILYLSSEENDKVTSLKNKWNVSKVEAIKKMIKDYKEARTNG